LCAVVVQFGHTFGHTLWDAGQVVTTSSSKKTQRVRLGFLFLASEKWALGFRCFFFSKPLYFSEQSPAA